MKLKTVTIIRHGLGGRNVTYSTEESIFIPLLNEHIIKFTSNDLLPLQQICATLNAHQKSFLMIFLTVTSFPTVILTQIYIIKMQRINHHLPFSPSSRTFVEEGQSSMSAMSE